MIKRTRFLTCILAGCMAVTLSACNFMGGYNSTSDLGSSLEERPSTKYPTEVPNYDEYIQSRRIEHMAFIEPYPTEQNYQWLAESGMTGVIIGDDNIERNKARLTLCDKYNITAYIGFGRGTQILKSQIEEYFEYDSFKGLYTDEPLTMAQLGIVFENNERLLGDKEGYEYVTTLICDKGEFETMEEYYDYYCSNMQGKTSQFWADIYPLKNLGYDSEIQQDWLYALQVGANAAKKYDMEMYQYISTMSIRSQNKRRPAYDDLMWTALVSLAYGAKGIGYFCYNSPGAPPYAGEFDSSNWAMVDMPDIYDTDGVTEDEWDKVERTETYYNVQKVISELNTFDHVLMSYDWEGTLVNYGKKAQTSSSQCFQFSSEVGYKIFVPMENHYRVKSMNSSEDMIVGTFVDENGYDGFLAVNFADPFYDLSNEIEITFDDARSALVYTKAGSEIVKLTNGKFSMSLGSGDGCFIIPIG